MTYRRWPAYLFFGISLAFCNTATAAAPTYQQAIRENHQHIEPANSQPALRPFDYSQQDISKVLGWVQVPVSPQNLCGGYYSEAKVVSDTPKPGAPKQQKTHISSQGPISYSDKLNAAVLTDHVVVTQPGRLIKADRALVYRDPKTHRISLIKLFGHVILEQHHYRIFAHYGEVHMNTHSAYFQNVVYHLYGKSLQAAKPSNGWGTAASAISTANRSIDLKHANYSTAAPTDPSWQIHASSIHINRQSNEGTAYNTWIEFQHVPFIWMPIYSFPTSKDRKTGFLNPWVGYSTTGGFQLQTPYYWNIAPALDLTTTPYYLSKRGVLLRNNMRFLTTHTKGNVLFSYIGHDRAFAKFKQNAKTEYPGAAAEYYNQLDRDTVHRSFISVNTNSQFNQFWSSNLHINYVSDPYYFQDFRQGSVNTSDVNQLLNQFDLDYQGVHWHDKILLQAYQALHALSLTPTSDIYMRAPEIDADASYPNLIHHVDAGLNMQAVDFAYQSVFLPGKPIGTRVHVTPYVSLPLESAAAYINPQLSFDTVSYRTYQFKAPLTHTAERSLPIADIDSGLYFVRQFHFAGTAFEQTLEPRLFYLYVPYKNQDNLPIYDTSLQPFSYNELFTTNAFTGSDRLQNANQLSFGLTSNVYNQNTGKQTLRLGVGVIDYFATPRVCLTPSCKILPRHYSPIAGLISFYPWTDWSVTGSSAWDPLSKQFDNNGVSVSYDQNNNHIFTVGYTFVKSNTPTVLDSNFVTTGLSWRLSEHWHTLGFWDYNASYNRPKSYFAGLEYDTCGWAFRVIGGETYAGNSVSGQTTHKAFNNSVYIQLNLKGLGGVGSDASSLLKSIPGYTDPFANQNREQ